MSLIFGGIPVMRNTLIYPVTHAERMEVLTRLRNRARGLTVPGNVDAMALDQCIVLLSAQHNGSIPPPDEHRED